MPLHFYEHRAWEKILEMPHTVFGDVRGELKVNVWMENQTGVT